MISVIIPTLNEETTVRQALEQFIGIAEPHEVIVADGGSADETIAIARHCELHGVKILSTPAGRARQMNAGARAALGDVLLFLHADTRLPSDGLEAVMQCMQGESMAGGRFKVKLDNQSFIYRIIGAMINVRDGIFGGFTGDQAIFIKKDTFEKIGGFREIDLCEDLDMARQLKSRGRVVRLPLFVTTSARRWEKGGAVKIILLMWLIRVLFYAGVSPQRLAKLYADIR